MQSLATKYRPKSWDEVAEQSATKVILSQQLASHEVKNAYLFCGSAGCGKTTCARIFANAINNGVGSPIELDAASNNSVDDVREIIQQAKTTSLDSEYKIFILDEVHALSNQAWQAMLKVLEEPPVKSIFIMCTTDPQKIPKTILSRVQRFNFRRISTPAIVERLNYVIQREIENGSQIQISADGIEFIAKQANGQMRDALTMLDKCLAYADTLDIVKITEALGLSDYACMTDLLAACLGCDSESQIKIINEVYMSGKDLKQFVKDFTTFVLDFCKFSMGVEVKYLSCPMTDEIQKVFNDTTCIESGEGLLNSLIRLQNDIKWDTNPKARIEVWCIVKENVE